MTNTVLTLVCSAVTSVGGAPPAENVYTYMYDWERSGIVSMLYNYEIF